MRRTHILIAALGALALAQSAAASPVGLWRAKDGAQIRVATCGKAVCGFIATTNPRLDPQTGRPPVDKHNPDPAKRHRPLAGMQILFGMAPSAPGVWSGELYNDDDGHTYRGKIRELGPKAIRIEGCAGALCGGEELTRLK
ncbi:MAG TPA: DUF2147 domain-containing protein [Pseudolabrys sp.]|uniref:DUF2147 domain-containing protein n=1 Tax=Pseudolabrys sp. TaxID=1960880 RepID=UPI002DDD87D7|nr:DUF2147 domain-containing protein [Pseudolabrys sp.]HEV2630520.1 DUF2147 domain-containing protein [Pseudolabrys sp.]